MLNFVVLANVAAAILIMILILGNNYYKYTKEETRNLLQGNVEHTAVYTSTYIDAIVNSAENLAADTKLGNALEDYLNMEDLTAYVDGKSNIHYILDKAIELNSYIEHITLVYEDTLIMRDLHGIVMVNNYMEKVYEEDWYPDLCSGKITYQLAECNFYKKPVEDDPYYFYATKFKNKYYSPGDKEEKLVIIIFNLDKLKEHLRSIANQEYIHINIVEDTPKTGKNILYQSSSDEQLSAYFTDRLDDEKLKNRIEKNYIFIEKEVAFNGWRIIGFVSKDTFSRMVYQVEPWMIVAILIVLTVSVLVSTISARIISKPIKNLVQAMHDMGHNKFHKVENETSCIEIEQMNFTYNQMSDKIEELIENIKLQEAEKRKIEFKVLENQINPHFIYNTLDVIKWVAHINRAEKTAKILESFVKLLRTSLSNGKEAIPLDSEISLIREYVNIMIFRNNYETEITYDIAEETRDCYTLKLVLQPFVENSFFHAFGDDKKEMRIDIKSRIENDMLVLEVTDNGKGFSLKHKKEKQQMTGIGIDNINDRIKMWYGEKYGVEISSKKNYGTTVIIRQPIIRKEELHDTYNDC